MAAAPSTFPAERFWTEEKEKTLIRFFCKHSCLWNHRSESYKNQQLRWKTLEDLRTLLSTQPPPVPFTVEDIKNKLKNLRTTFQRQYKMAKASAACGAEDGSEPQWNHYQQLMFLESSWVQDDDDGVLPQDETPAVASSPGLSTSCVPFTSSSCVPATSSSTSSSCVPSTSSSCVPSNMLIKCSWTEERERAVITFYSEHSCLWNKKSENHNNRQLRLSLLETLRARLSDQSVSFSVEDIKCKFKNLRTVFNREVKAVHASRASDKPYVSKWKHFQQLLFFCEPGDEDHAADDLQAQKPGSQTPSSGSAHTNAISSASAPAGSAHTNAISNASAPAGSAQSNAGTSASGGHHVLPSASPDGLNSSDQTATRPSSPSPSPTDTKPCTSSSPHDRATWSEAKVQQLISFYSERSCLWNHKSQSYRNRLLRQSLLETLSGLLSHNQSVPFTVEDIKTKFRNLRSVFQREHKAVSSNRTCGSEDFYLPKWRHYHDLLFLCDSCDEDERPEHLLLHLDGQATPPALHYDASGLNVAGRAFEAPPSPTPPDSQHTSPSSSPPPSTSSSRAGSRPPGRKRAAPGSGDMLRFMRAWSQSQAVSPHAGFLKYVEECLNETPPDAVKTLKKKIIETIHRASEDV